MIFTSVRIITVIAMTAACGLATSSNAGPVPAGTTFTYQGQLKQGGNSVNASADFEFRLFDVPADGTPVAAMVQIDGVAVADGLFTVEIDFGAGVFDGTERWLDIAVRSPAGSGAFTTLSPRQRISPTPLAVFALNAANVPASSIGGTYGNQVLFTNPSNAFIGDGSQLTNLNASNIINGTIAGNLLSGTYFNAMMFNNPANVFAGDGAGLTSINADNITTGTFNDARLSSNVALLTGAQHFTGQKTFAASLGIGTSDPAATLHVVEGTSGTGLFLPGLRVLQNAVSPSLAGGYSGNIIESGFVGVTIGGGGAADSINRARDAFTTIAGGAQNIAGATAIGGGLGATVGGGFGNTASGFLSVIAGGDLNSASGEHSTVGGGFGNSAAGLSATVPGGESNLAGANYSFAAGRRAQANHVGSFVWADSTDADFTSSGGDQFIIRASEGVGIGTNSPTSALDVSGTVTATAFAGDGSALTNVPSIWTEGGGNAYFETGNVGIGVVNPTALLHVAEGASGTGVILPGLRVFQNPTSPSIVGGYSGNVIEGGFAGATIAGGGTAGSINLARDAYTTVSGGLQNVAGDIAIGGGIGATVGGGFGNTASGNMSVIAGGNTNTASGQYSSVIGGSGNAAGGLAATVVGGESNVAAGNFSFAAGRRAKANHAGSFVWADSADADFQSTASNQFLVRATGGIDMTGFRIVQNATSPNVIAGHSGNIVEGGYVGATIGGGGVAGSINRVRDNYTTVSGGLQNTAGDVSIGGGNGATVGGGFNNTANGVMSVIAGGSSNTASGQFSAVPGGSTNVAGGNYSFAAGRRSKANHAGSFVWADSTDADFVSTGNNQLLIRAGGGVGIGTSSPTNLLTVAGSANFTGNVGIGTSAPASALHVAGTVTAASFVGNGSGLTNLPLIWNMNGANTYFTGGSVGIGTNVPSNPLTVAGNANVTGNLGVGISTPTNRFSVNGNADVSGSFTSGSTVTGVVIANGPAFLHSSLQVDALSQFNNVATFSAGVADGFTVNGSSTTAGSATISGNADVGGNLVVQNHTIIDNRLAVGSTDLSVRLSCNGDAMKPGGGMWSFWSDARLKHDIVPIATEGGMLDRFLALHGCTFEYNQEAIDHRMAPAGPQIGLIAQDVQKIFPEWVTTANNGYLMVSEKGLTAIIVESMRELRAEKDAQIQKQQEQVDTQQQLIEQLLRRIERLEAKE